MVLLKSLSIGLLSVAFVLAALALLVRLLENRLTFYPWREFESLPEDFGLEYEEIRLCPAAGDTIHGWYFRPRETDSPVLLLCHGNAGNISHRLEWLAPFVEAGLGAVLFDYRGYGLSSGKPGEIAFREDALAVWDFLTRQKGIPPRDLVVIGRSLGGAPASWLAGERESRCLVLEGVFGQGKEMAAKLFGFLPVHLVMRNRWALAEYLKRVRVPVLIIHGTRDEVVPFRLGERLAAQCDPSRVAFWPVEGGGHLDLHQLLGEEYYRRILKFIRGA